MTLGPCTHYIILCFCTTTTATPTKPDVGSAKTQPTNHPMRRCRSTQTLRDDDLPNGWTTRRAANKTHVCRGGSLKQHCGTPFNISSIFRPHPPISILLLSSTVEPLPTTNFFSILYNMPLRCIRSSVCILQSSPVRHQITAHRNTNASQPASQSDHHNTPLWDQPGKCESSPRRASVETGAIKNSPCRWHTGCPSLSTCTRHTDSWAHNRMTATGNGSLLSPLIPMLIVNST